MKQEKFNELVIKAKTFYNSLGVRIPKKIEQQAVESLSLPEFVNQFKLTYGIEFNDHRALATVGDSVCETYLMLKVYKENPLTVTSDNLTDEKEKLTNQNLNEIGKMLLGGHLFAFNNDLKEDNKKAYATSFEAVVGFLSLINVSTAFNLLSKHIN